MQAAHGAKARPARLRSRSDPDACERLFPRLILDPETMPSFLPAHPPGLPGEMHPPSPCGSRVTGCTVPGALDGPKFPVAEDGMLWVSFEQP